MWIEVLKWILVGTAGALALCLVVYVVAHLIDNISLTFFHYNFDEKIKKD
jgi:hypothetical protein